MILLHEHRALAGPTDYELQKQQSAWHNIKQKLGPAMRVRNADDVMEIQIFLNKFLGAQDAFLISAFIGTGVSGKYQSVTDARTSVETLADEELDTFEKADNGKSYGSQTKSGKTVQEAFQNARQVLYSEYYDWLLTAGEVKKIEADSDFRDNVNQELSDMSNKLISGVKNAIVPSPLFGVGAGVVIGVGLFLYLMVRRWESSQSVTDARTSVETLADEELDTFEKADNEMGVEVDMITEEKSENASAKRSRESR